MNLGSLSSEGFFSQFNVKSAINRIMIPQQPANSYRVTLELTSGEPRLDSVLMNALRNQRDHLKLRTITRSEFKTLFNEKRILIKNQPARASSSLCAGTTYVDILGF